MDMKVLYTLSELSACKTAVHSLFATSCWKVHWPEEVIFLDVMYLILTLAITWNERIENTGK